MISAPSRSAADVTRLLAAESANLGTAIAVSTLTIMITTTSSMSENAGCAAIRPARKATRREHMSPGVR
jgi:hypothetical protein